METETVFRRGVRFVLIAENTAICLNAVELDIFCFKIANIWTNFLYINTNA